MVHIISRRHFLSMAPAMLCTAAWLKAAPKQKSIIMTVTGPVNPVDLGPILPHEHVLVDFIGAAKITPRRYNEAEVYKVILPHLTSLRQTGCRCMMECTPDFLGRNVRLLQKLSIASGIKIITNTGLYGAGAHKFLPAYVQRETAAQLAARWIGEWKNGIGNTGIKPGFIKSGVDKGPLTPLQRKLIEAAGLTWKQTGLPIGIHTGNGVAAIEESEILKSMGVPLQSYIWIHAQNETNADIHEKLAAAGAWISFDGLNKYVAEDYIKRLTRLKAAGFLDQVLLSHDAGWYNVGQKGGGTFRDYNYLLGIFVHLLPKHGFTAMEIRKLTVENPARAFTITS
jgi:phosphotriesterase-related protein